MGLPFPLRPAVTAGLLGAVLLTGCLQFPAERDMRSDIIVKDDRHFVFEATAFDRGRYAKDSDQGEATRTGLLIGELDRKGLCPNGYRIVKREERVIGNAPASQGREWLLQYIGECR